MPLPLDKERGKILKRGTGAPLKHPHILAKNKEIKRVR